MKALVVDDDLTTRILLEEVLSGYAEVHTSVDGDEAVLAYRRELERGEPYDLVCMDIHMPKMNGIEALNLIRREERLDPMLRSRHTKIVMTTGSDERSSIDQAFQTLCDAYMVKPIDIKEFRDVLECLFPIQSRD